MLSLVSYLQPQQRLTAAFLPQTTRFSGDAKLPLTLPKLSELLGGLAVRVPESAGIPRLFAGKPASSSSSKNTRAPKRNSRAASRHFPPLLLRKLAPQLPRMPPAAYSQPGETLGKRNLTSIPRHSHRPTGRAPRQLFPGAIAEFDREAAISAARLLQRQFLGQLFPPAREAQLSRGESPVLPNAVSTLLPAISCCHHQQQLKRHNLRWRSVPVPFRRSRSPEVPNLILDFLPPL